MRRLRPLRQRRLRPEARFAAADPGRRPLGLARGAPWQHRCHAPQAAAQRRARLRGRLRSVAALVRGRLGVGGRAGGRADGQEHRRHLPERRQRRTQLLRAPGRHAVRAIQAAPADHRTRAGSRYRHRRRHDDHAGHQQRAGLLQQARLRHGRRPERRHEGLRHALRRRHGWRGIRSRDHSGRRLQPAQPLALREPRLLVRRCALAAADGLAGPLAGCLRLAVESAPGRLARLQPLQADPLGHGARVRTRGPAGRRLPCAGRDGRREQRDRQAGDRAGRGGERLTSRARAA